MDGGGGPGESERVKTCSIKSLTEEPHNRASRYYLSAASQRTLRGKPHQAKHSRLVDLQQAARCLSQQPAIVLEGSVADYLSRGRGGGGGGVEGRRKNNCVTLDSIVYRVSVFGAEAAVPSLQFLTTFESQTISVGDAYGPE